MRKKLFTFLLALVASVGLSWATEGALSGAFAINGDGDYIAFSKGNLQYHCTNHVWQFATNQYDIIGGDNANISDSYNGWVDLFGYGTGNNPTLVSTSYGDYSTFTDWGVNAISNGGNEANLWRTLTSTEWLYMFRLRPEAHNKYGAATVANVPGIIVLPDVYVGPAINTVRDAWDNNVISSSEWAAYEAAGAVFLPAAGYRSGTTMYNVGSEGFCWSSTPDPGDAEYSYKLCLSPISVIEPQGFGRRNEGISVRLIKAASAQDIADVVIALINAIPNPVAYNDECKDAIDAARAAYDALTDAQKDLVENYGDLLDAETAYAQSIPHPHGECGAQGNNLLWDLDPSTGVLTITGSGAMNDWAVYSNLPWYDNRSEITSVVLPSGITSIGTQAFRECTNLASINMTENYPAGLTAINQEAFFHTALTSVTIPESVVTIGRDAFFQNENITDVYCYADPNNLTWNDFWCDDFKDADHATVCHVKACALSTFVANWGGTPYRVKTSTGVNVTFVGDLPGDCGGSTPSYIDADFAIDFRTDPYTKVGGGDLPAGVLVEGSMNTGDPQHGYRLPVITIPVTAGNYKVMMGTCSYSNQDATVKTEDGSHTYATLATNNGTCYHNNTTANVVGAIFTVPSDQIIKVHGAEYTPYFSIEKMPEIPAFTNFELDFQTDPYSVSGAKPEGTVIAGSFHDNLHGYQNVEATVPVKAGKYRLTLGACEFDSNAGTVMSETNVELASFNQNLGAGKCYHNNTTKNIVSVIFDVDKDQHITIDCGQYTPFMKLEAVTSYAVEFALGDAEGTAPAALDVTVGNEIAMPVNKTLYKAGYTLTGWSDGVNTYPIGESFTPANDVVLTPVFTANEADLLNASTDVTVTWYFGGGNGAPTTSYEGTSGLLVAQATIGNKTVDVKLAIDATSGKFAPQPATEWAQVVSGTIFTYPYKAGMTVNVGNYNPNVTYYIADAEGKVNCVTNDYYSFIEVTYPASTTAVVIGDPNDASQIETFLTNNNGQTIDELIINRPVLNNMYNTLCLPFDMNAAQIAASSLNGVEIREFTGASVEGTTLNLSVGDPVNAVVAGRPYFVKYSAASQLDNLHFEGVTINNALLDNMAVTFDGVTFKGTFTPFVMPNGLNFQGGYLFLGQNNQLFWPNTPNPLKPFRAYFYVNVESSTPGNAPKYRGMPARIVEGKNVATGVENAQSANQSTKVIVNGQLIIIKNDVRYNAQGQIVK